MSISKKLKQDNEEPFEIVFNYRTIPKLKQNSSAKSQKTRMQHNPHEQKFQKHRKMTEHIKGQNNIQEQYLLKQVQSVPAQFQPYNEEIDNFEQYQENRELYELSALQKAIPVQLRQQQLDQQSPLEISTFRNLSSFEQHFFRKIYDMPENQLDI